MTAKRVSENFLAAGLKFRERTTAAIAAAPRPIRGLP